MPASFKIMRQERLAFGFGGTGGGNRWGSVRVWRAPAGFVRGSADELIFEVLGPKDRNFDEKQLARYHASVGIVENSPNRDLYNNHKYVFLCWRLNGRRVTYEIFELSASLLDDAVLTTDDDRHTTQVANFSATDNQRIDVEPSSSQDTGHAR